MLDLYQFIAYNPIFKQFNVNELLFTAYDCAIEESQLDYWVDKNYFCYIVRGGVKWKTLDNEYTIEVGEAAFIRRGAHRIAKISYTDFCALLIFLPDEFIRTVLREEQLTEPKDNIGEKRTNSIVPITPDQSLFDYFTTVLNYFNQPRPPSKNLLRIKFRELIVNLATGHSNPGIRDCLRQISGQSRRALRLTMENNFHFDLQLAEFASLTGRSLATFNREFHKEFQTSPGRWLKQKRLEYSKFLLETTDLNVNEIALESGFKNTSHYIRVFKQHFGSTPLKYKKAAVAYQNRVF